MTWFIVWNVFRCETSFLRTDKNCQTVQFEQEKPAVKGRRYDFACMICVYASLQQPRLDLCWPSNKSSNQTLTMKRGRDRMSPTKEKKKRIRRGTVRNGATRLLRSFPDIPWDPLEDLDSSAKMKKIQLEAQCQPLNYTCKTSERKRPCKTGRNDGLHVNKRALRPPRTGAGSLVHM